MGLKLSCIHRGSLSRQVGLPVRVITADGSLKEFPASPLAAVSAVLGLGLGESSFFICNSDAFYFNEHPPALAPRDLLRPGQIYFVLSAAMFGSPLSCVEMPDLAVCASVALASSSNKAQRCGRRRGSSKVRVMPVWEEQETGGGDDVLFNRKLNEQTLGEFRSTMSWARSDKKVTAAAAARSRPRRA